MSNKTPHKRLQRLAEDELGKRPKLMFCLRLMSACPKRAEESLEQWAARVFLDNRSALEASADAKASETQ